MMKRFCIIIIIALGLTTGLSSCKKYLDVVPSNVATLNDAFKTPNNALNFFYSLYSYIPPISSITGSLSMEMWGTDEIAIPWTKYPVWNFVRGGQSSSSPYMNYWSTGGSGMYDGIRQCYIFLDNIDKTPNLDPIQSNADSMKTVMKGEAYFLIGYYHFVLLRQYGPLVPITGETDITASGSSFYPKRQPYDSCVNFIANMLDKAATMLPATQSLSNLGRATSVVAKSIKARMLLYAASPLCNGNTDYYSNFKNKDGQALMNLTYDANKWKRAADACLDAINAAQAQNIQLYTYTGTLPTGMTQAQANYRYSMVDPWNKELIWGYSKSEPYYGFQRHSFPRVTQSNTAAYNGNSPTLKMVETYYTANGLPINVDPSFNYNSRYTINGSTILLHQNREPRFYASIAYNGGSYFCNSTSVTMNFLLNGAEGTYAGAANYSPSGYLVQKGVHPNSIITTSSDNLISYPWPLVRLAELYLDYAEALNEYSGTSAQNTVISYIDPIRQRSGIPGVLTSWGLVGKTSFTQDEMRQIIRQERMIELGFEGHRIWDIRRWKLGDTYFNVPVQGMNIQATTAATFYQPTIIETRTFTTPNSYFWPISTNDLSVNSNLVQNPGW
jgi:hypothetical protein